MNELVEYLKPLIKFGKLEIEISKEKVGNKLNVIDCEEVTRATNHLGMKYIGEEKHTVVTIYTDPTGVVSLIEHGYTPLTQRNHREVSLLMDLVGQRIEVPTK